jgi:hypothetical protein
MFYSYDKKDKNKEEVKDLFQTGIFLKKQLEKASSRRIKVSFPCLFRIILARE